MALVLYGRDGCHLCEQMLEELDECLRGRASVQVVDVDTDDRLRERHGLRVPVLELDGRELCHGRLDAAVARALTTGLMRD